MLFLVDGYNVTRSDPATTRLTLEEQRTALVQRLRARGAQMLGTGPIVVIFDGAQGSAGAPVDSAPVRVVFARSGSADDAIVRAVGGATGTVVVVSNDRELRGRVAVHARGDVESRPASACFEAAGKGAERKGRRPSPPRDVGLPAGANKITKELKDLWLGEDEQ
jgi:predicted RNA-binding protein with PIN domain